MRLFAAIEIPASVRDALASAISELRAISPEQRWVPAENLHITLKFLGETNAESLSAVTKALTNVTSRPAVSLEIAGLGFFPGGKRPRVIAAGVIAGPNLAALASAIDGALLPLGVAPNEHEYRPHLTLARLREGRLAEPLLEAVRGAGSRKFGTIQAAAFQLFESKLERRGAIYTRLSDFPLVTGGA